MLFGRERELSNPARRPFKAAFPIREKRKVLPVAKHKKTKVVMMRLFFDGKVYGDFYLIPPAALLKLLFP